MTEQPGQPPVTPGGPLGGGGQPPPPSGAPAGQPAPPPPAPPAAPTAPPPAPPAQYPAAPVAVGPAGGELAIKRSVVRCAVATFLSWGAYSYWWFYQYRKRLNAELAKNDDAGLHTAGLLVPFLNFYLIYLLWKDISDARVRVGLSEIPVIGYIIGTIFLAPVFYGLINASLNEYWDRRTGGRAVDAPWTTGEKLVTIIPMVLIWGLFLLFIVIGIVVSASSSS